MSRSIIRREFPYSYYNASFVLIALNIAVFLATSLRHSFLNYLVLYPPAIMYNRAYWEFFTYMFAHANVTHILFNMLGLFFFGPQVERRMGSNEFVVFYLLIGILAGIFSYIIYVATGAMNVALLGASGAIYGVLLAFATYFPNSTIYVMGILPVKAPLLVLIFTAIEIGSQIFNLGTGVAHLTHLAGFGFAYFYLLIRLGMNPLRIFFGNDRRRLP